MNDHLSAIFGPNYAYNPNTHTAYLIDGTTVVFQGMKMDGSVIVDHSNGSRERIVPSRILNVTGPNSADWKNTSGGMCRAGNCPWPVNTSTGTCDHD